MVGTSSVIWLTCCVKKLLFHFQEDTFSLIKDGFINPSCTFSILFIIWHILCPFFFGAVPAGSACAGKFQWSHFPKAGAMHVLCAGSHSHAPQCWCSLRAQSSASCRPRDAPCRAKHVHGCCWSFPHLMTQELFQSSKPFLSLKLSLSFYRFCHSYGMEWWELNTTFQVRAYAWFIQPHCGLLPVILEAIHDGSLCAGRVADCCCCWAKVFICLSTATTPRWLLHVLENYGWVYFLNMCT